MGSQQKSYIMMAIGALGAMLITSYVPQLMKVLSTYPPDYANYPRSKEILDYTPLEKINGIDTEALSIIRQKGWM
jgi:hypothetical protein